MIKYSIVVPAFNEEKILEFNINKLHKFLQSNYKNDFEIIIGDDGSKDSTQEIIKKLEKRYPNISNIKNNKNLGRGSVLTKGFTKAKGKLICYIDADLAINMELILDLFNELQKGYDLAIGSKHLQNSNVKYNPIRKILSNSYSSITKLILSTPFQDYQCGMKAIKKTSFIKLYPFIKEIGWAWDTELIVLAYKHKMKIKELPAIVKNIKERKSKVIIIKDIYKMFSSLLRIRKRVNKIKKVYI
mgnify:CR=1 FL=1|tara:strand:+ start:26305 stop:27036 length:732 start_codon:yes stop_codon:yes gene_type:complete